jgi:hypothetical protein
LLPPRRGTASAAGQAARGDFPHYFEAHALAAAGYALAAATAERAAPTIAALAPDDVHVELVDEQPSPVDFDTDADVVGIIGKVSPWGRMRELAIEFRRRGKPVLIGGPYATRSPTAVA